MNKNLYVLFDKKIGEFALPFWQPDDNTCIVTLTREIKNGDSVFAKNPEDFVAYRVGTFDCKSGVLTGELVKLQDFAEVR